MKHTYTVIVEHPANCSTTPAKMIAAQLSEVFPAGKVRYEVEEEPGKTFCMESNWTQGPHVQRRRATLHGHPIELPGPDHMPSDTMWDRGDEGSGP